MNDLSFSQNWLTELINLAPEISSHKIGKSGEIPISKPKSTCLPAFLMVTEHMAV